MSGKKVVVILGATGAGKSKLSLQIAQKFNGEIISTDSMQVYKGLDIVTNKVTPEEQKIVPHHMIDFLSPVKTDYNVVDFRNAALSKINSLFDKEKLPVIVGGTNYYIESILWDFLIPRAKSQQEKQYDNSDTEGSEKYNSVKFRPFNKSTPELFNYLKNIDPASAGVIHPNDRRKILRAIEVYHQHSVPMSELIKEQHSLKGASEKSGPLRFTESCVLWVQCNQKTLDERTNKRVDEMINQGLLSELEEFHKLYNQQRVETESNSNYEKGIFQSIGFKEFHDYLMLSAEERQTEEGIHIFQKGVEEMKTVTRRYARKQNKWIVNRFLARSATNTLPVYGLDSTHKDEWQSNVYQPACDIVDAFLRNVTPCQSPLPLIVKENKRELNECEICDVICGSTDTWKAHLNSRGHHKRLSALKKREKELLLASKENNKTKVRTGFVKSLEKYSLYYMSVGFLVIAAASYLLIS